jgi:hypothetical protein
MYAFGDSSNPDPASIELLEEYMLNNLETLLLKSFERAIRRDPEANKITKEDLLYYLKGNTKALARVLELIRFEKKTAQDTKN